MNDAAASVRQAVQSLYSWDPAQQAQANTWLSEFQQTDAAWNISCSFLQKEEPYEIQFFATSLLLRKVRTEWSKTNLAVRGELRHAFSSIFSEALTWPAPHKASPLILRQLCLLQAAALVGDGSALAGELIAKALALVHTSTAAGLDLLSAAAEEASDLDRGRRSDAIAALLAQAPQVLDTLSSMLPQALSQPEHEGGAQCLRAIRAWLVLSTQPGGGCSMGPGDVHRRHPQLYLGLLSAVVGEHSGDSVVESATQSLLDIYGSGTFGPEDDHDGQAIQELISALLTVRPRLATAGEWNALAVAQLGSAAGERWPEGVCGRVIGAAQLCELMLDCIGCRGEAVVVEAALEYFLMVNTVPLAERPQEMGQPLYASMVARLQRHVAYPQGFTSWEESVDRDADDFNRLRDSLLPEALEEAYGLLRSWYLSGAWQALQDARTWQDAEAALFLFGAVALHVRTRAMAVIDYSKDASVIEDLQRTRSVLAAVFTYLCSGAHTLLAQSPVLASSACWLIEKYAVWFGKDEDAPLHAALQCTSTLLATPAAASAACKAFHALCLRCTTRMKEPSLVASLASQIHSSMQTLSLDDQRLLIEGLAHTAAGLPGADSEVAITQLTRPFADQVKAAVESAGAGEPSLAARQAAAHSLHLLAASLKSLLPAALAQGSSGGGAAVCVLRSIESTMGVLARSPAWHTDLEVMEALVEVSKQAVCSARRRSFELLPAVLPAVGAVFSATALPSCLDVLSEALEIHFQNSEVVQGLLEGMRSACLVAFPLLQGDGLRERGTLATALLGLADSFAVYAPAALWPNPQLPALLGLAIATLSLREAEPVVRALSFLGHVIGTQERAADDDALTPAHADAVHTALAAQGQSMCDALLRSLCDTCPRQHMRTAADRLRTLLTHPAFSQHAPGWLQTCVLSGQLPGTAEGALTAEACSKFVQLALGGGLRAPRLCSLIVDFGLVGRREETVDVLLAYEL